MKPFQVWNVMWNVVFNQFVGNDTRYVIYAIVDNVWLHCKYELKSESQFHCVLKNYDECESVFKPFNRYSEEIANDFTK